MEVQSVRNGQKHGFVMDSDEIEERIRDGREAEYHPRAVEPEAVEIDLGTRITLTNMKRQLQWTGKPLRRRLARRFSIIGAQQQFEVELDGKPVTVEDREYQDKLQYIWTFGEKGIESGAAAKNLEHSEERSGYVEVQTDLAIDGWIGTASNSGQLKDSDTNESINKIVVIVRGKLAQEDILEEFGEGDCIPSTSSAKSMPTSWTWMIKRT